MGKKTLVLIYGGRSTEHDVACRSAAFVYRSLDRTKYDLHLVGVDKNGDWYPQQDTSAWDREITSLPIERDAKRAMTYAPPVNPRGALAGLCGLTPEVLPNCVFFPMIHGVSGEDGTLQGLFELAGVAFVGPDTLGSAIGMDKVVAKRLAASAGIPVVPFVEVNSQMWSSGKDSICQRAIDILGLPLFIKPARLGSSVGISKVKDPAGLPAAIEQALGFDDKVLVEIGLNVREVECAMLGAETARPSVVGEVVLDAEFYSYEEKYAKTSKASTRVPADLSPELTAEIQKLSGRVFEVLALYGMARVDWFLEKNTGQLYFNEVNTIPGFTQVSHYPLFWSKTGKDPASLLTDLIELGVQRARAKSSLKKEIPG
jgi:D-alanine-D-alanine ligase